MKQKSENDNQLYTILVVEDDTDLLGLIRHKLKQAGFQTAGVLSGTEAIARLADHRPPTLLLLDYRLLDMTGKEVIETLNEQQRSVPFITITGQNDAQVAVEMMKLGSRDYVVKGAGFLELLVPIIQQALEQLTTEKRLAKAEEKLRESEAHFRALFENSPVSLWEEDFSAVKAYLDELRVSGVTNLRSYFEQHPESVVECVRMVNVIDVNKAALELHAAESKEELLGSLETILGKERLETFREELLTLAAGDATFEQETILKTTTGDKKHVIVKLFIPPGYEATWSKISVSIMDITKHKRAEEKIRRQNEFLNSIIESLAHPFYVIKANDYTLEIANSAARSFGMTTTKTCYALAHQSDKPCDDPEHPCPLVEVKQTKKPAIVEHIHFDKEGNPRNVEVHGYPIFNRKGDIVQMIEYTLDITERKQVEEKLRKYRDHLEELVEERTVELAKANQQLQQEITERKQAEEGQSKALAKALQATHALRESEERFRQVINSISDHIYVTEITKDNSLVNRYLSPHVEPLTGYPREKFASDWSFWPSTVIHPDDRAVAAAQLNQLVSGQNSKAEYRLVRADDRIIWIRDSARVHSRDDSKTIYGLVSDISERKQLEERLAAIYQLGRELILLRDETAIIQRVLATATNALRFKDTGWGLVDRTAGELRYLYRQVDSGLQEIDLRLPLDGTKGIGVAVVHSEQAINVPDTGRDPRYISLLPDHPSHSELCVPVKIGRQIIGVLNVESAAPNHFTDSDQQLLQTLADQAAVVLENARLYAETQRRAQQLTVLHELDQAITASLRIDDVYRAITHHTARLLPYDRMSVTMLEGDSLRSAYIVDGSKTVLLTEITLPRHTSGVGWVITHNQPLLRHNIAADMRFAEDESLLKLGLQSTMVIPLQVKGQVIGTWNIAGRQVSAYSPDDLQIAQAMADQLAIALENARLYQAEREQYRRLQQSQTQLIQVEKMAALGRLAASLAHEVNNPLQAVDSCLTLVEEELVGSPYQQELGQYLAMAVEEVERVSTIVRRMRDFYRPTPQNRQFQTPDTGLVDNFYRSRFGEWQVIGLHTVLNSVLQLAKKQLQNSNVTVERAWSDELPMIQGRADYLKQLFLNLVLNAIDAMDAQGGVLRINTNPGQIEIPGKQPLPAVSIEFSDTGEGIPPEMLSRLFEPLFTTKEQGSGFGLFTSYKIIEAQNGQITVSSQVGEGTTFNILLPVTQPN